jgi:hypothetical protein
MFITEHSPSLRFERQTSAVRADLDFIAGFEFAFEQLRRERIEQMFLNRVRGKRLEVLVVERVTTDY